MSVRLKTSFYVRFEDKCLLGESEGTSSRSTTKARVKTCCWIPLGDDCVKYTLNTTHSHGLKILWRVLRECDLEHYENLREGLYNRLSNPELR